MNTADPVHFTLTPPECHMEIRNGYGTTGTRVAGPVHVGDPLTLMILMRSAWGKLCLIFFSLRSLIYVFDSLHISVTSFLFLLSFCLCDFIYIKFPFCPSCLAQ